MGDAGAFATFLNRLAAPVRNRTATNADSITSDVRARLWRDSVPRSRCGAGDTARADRDEVLVQRLQRPASHLRLPTALALLRFHEACRSIGKPCTACRAERWFVHQRGDTRRAAEPPPPEAEGSAPNPTTGGRINDGSPLGALPARVARLSCTRPPVLAHAGSQNLLARALTPLVHPGSGALPGK